MHISKPELISPPPRTSQDKRAPIPSSQAEGASNKHKQDKLGRGLLAALSLVGVLGGATGAHGHPKLGSEKQWTSLQTTDAMNDKPLTTLDSHQRTPREQLMEAIFELGDTTDYLEAAEEQTDLAAGGFRRSADHARSLMTGIESAGTDELKSTSHSGLVRMFGEVHPGLKQADKADSALVLARASLQSAMALVRGAAGQPMDNPNGTETLQEQLGAMQKLDRFLARGQSDIDMTEYLAKNLESNLIKKHVAVVASGDAAPILDYGDTVHADLLDARVKLEACERTSHVGGDRAEGIRSELLKVVRTIDQGN
jgi:hypothetical protein